MIKNFDKEVKNLKNLRFLELVKQGKHKRALKYSLENIQGKLNADFKMTLSRATISRLMQFNTMQKSILKTNI